MIYLEQLMNSKIPRKNARMKSSEANKGANLLFLTDNAPLYNFLDKQRPDFFGTIVVPNLFGTILGKKILNTKYYSEIKRDKPNFKISKVLKLQDAKKTNIFDMSHFSNYFLELLNEHSQKMVQEKLFNSFHSILKDFKKFNSSNKNYLIIYNDPSQESGGSHFIDFFEYISQLNANKITTSFDGIFYSINDFYYQVAIKENKESKSKKENDNSKEDSKNELIFVRNNLKMIKKIVQGSLNTEKLDNFSSEKDVQLALEDKTQEIKINKIREDIIQLTKKLDNPDEKKKNEKLISNLLIDNDSELNTIEEIKNKVKEYKNISGSTEDFESSLKKLINNKETNSSTKTDKITQKNKDIQKEYIGMIDLILSKKENMNRVFNMNNVTGIDHVNGYDRQRTEFKKHIDNELKDMFLNFEADSKLNLKILEFKPSNIKDDNKNIYKEYSVKVQHKDFGKTYSKPYTIKFKVPVPQIDKYFKLNGQHYILINQIYPKPIIKVNQNLARLHTMYTNTTAYEIKKSKLDNEDFKFIETDFISELQKDKSTSIEKLDNDIKEDLIDKYELPLDFINFQYAKIQTKTEKYNYLFDFRKERFFEQSEGTLKNKNVIKYASYSKDNKDIVLFDNGDIKKYPKKHFNEFVMKLYEDLAKEKYNQGILNKNASAKPYFTARLLKNNIPVIKVIIMWLGFKSAMKYLNIKYTIGKKTPLSVKLDTGDYLNLYPETLKQEYFSNGLLFDKKLILKKKDIINNSKEVLDDYFSKWINSNKTEQLHELRGKIIDKMTSKLLFELNYSDDIIEIFSNILPDMLLTRNDKNSNELDNYRIRMSETIVHKLFEQMNQSVGYLKKRENTIDAKLEINPDFLNQYLSSTGIIQNTFSINPLEELNVSMKTTKSGVGNSLKSQITLEKRDLNRTHFGTISPTSTNEYGGIGLTQTLTNQHELIDKFGNIKIKDFNNKENPYKNLSAIESLTPFVDRNDTTRVVMGNQQTGQFLQLKSPDEALTQTGFESFIPKMVSERFTKKSPIEGTILDIKDNIIIIKSSKNSKIHKINCNSVKARNKRGIYMPLNYNINVKIGQKVKENDILAAGDSLKTGKLAIGKNLNVAIMGYLGANYEDGWAMTQRSANKYKAKIYKRLQLRIPPDADIIDYNIKKGSTDNGDVLLSYKRKKLYDFQTDSDFDIEEDSDTLIALNSKDNISKFFSPGGEIKDIIIKINDTDSNIIKEKHKENIKELEKIKKICSEENYGSEQQGYSSEFYNCLGSHENSDQIRIGGHKLRGHEFQGVLIEIFIEFDHTVMNGSKFTLGNTGAKGTVQYIIPEGKEPVATESGLKIDFIPTPISIIGRKNPGILFNLYLSKVMYFLNKVVIELAKEKKIQKIKSLVLEIYTCIDKTPDKVILKDLNAFFKTSTDNIIKTINDSDPLTKPAFPAIVQPFYNKITMKDISNAANILGVPLNETVTYTENGITSKTKVPVGILNVYLLEHIPKYMGSVRGSLNNNYNLTTGQGRSGTKEGDGASQIGLYDLYSLLTFRPYNMLKELHSIKSDNSRARTKLNNKIIKLKDNEYPSISDISIEKEDNTSKNMSEYLFLGSGLNPKN